MKGYPSQIATRADIDYLVSYLGSPFANQENKNKGLTFLNNLLNTKVYTFDKTLTSTESPTGAEPDYKVLENQGANNDERHQFILTDNANAKMYSLGLTVTEVQNYISQVEGAA